jgi:hypothetical protein
MAVNDRSAQLRRDLRAIVGDGVAFSVMVGAGESYIPAFALAAGLGEITAGLVATLPMLVGAAFQLVTPVAVRRLGSARRWVVLCASAQAASFAPLVIAALSGRLSRPVLFLAAAAYWGFGMATGPAWNTWVTQIVPRPIRSRFFAARSRWSQVAVLAGLIAGGMALQTGAGSERRLPIFAALFGTALLARAVSSRFLASQSEPGSAPPGSLRISPGAFLATFRDPAHGRLLSYLIWIQLAVNVSAPYFTPFMLGPLKLSYAEYALLIGTPFIARIAALPALGSLAHRSGSRALVGSPDRRAALWLTPELRLLLGVQVRSRRTAATLLSPTTSRGTTCSRVQPGGALAVVLGAGWARCSPRLGPQLVPCCSTSSSGSRASSPAAFNRLSEAGGPGSGRAAGRCGCSGTARRRARTSPRRGSWRTPA